MFHAFSGRRGYGYTDSAKAGESIDLSLHCSHVLVVGDRSVNDCLTIAVSTPLQVELWQNITANKWHSHNAK